ncbi:MAG: DUF885 domain-containing protein [Acidobacteria bacterium]|nr:MAG: DUF885 domain-containing protein [Acidobacteriota bacterium]
MTINVCLLLILLFSGLVFADNNSSLNSLFSEEWNYRLKEDPLFATNAGNHQYDDRLPSVTKADQDRRAEYYRGLLKKLNSIDRSTLSKQDQISYDLFKYYVEDYISFYEFHSYLIPLNADSGFQTEFAHLPHQLTFASVKDYENYIARLHAFPTYVQQNIELMREAIRIGMVLPRAVMNGFEVTMTTHIVDAPEKSVFYPPFQSFPVGVPESEHQRLRAEGSKAITDYVIPAYKTLLEFMQKEYLPHTRDSLAASQLPNGEKYYAFLVRHFTTLPLTPEELHQTGLREVSRIHKEMEDIIRSVHFEGDFAAFLQFLRTDNRFYAKTPEELLKDAAYIAKQMDGKLPSLFKTLPRTPYGVAPVPDYLAPKYTGGRYVEPPEGSTEPGIYWVNTYALESRPLYVLESLTFHEAVPGHHLQISLARELQNLPEFRKFLYIDTFGEGWGLYSEWLGLEAGFYRDPYSNFGRLTYEMWRACRLVVDTGIHTKGWTRDQAMQYLASNTALSLHECQTETDRYISWPGQALAYKTGELKIKELRHKAETALGPKFDVREFHDAILANGSVTLPILERMIDDYITSASSRQ